MLTSLELLQTLRLAEQREAVQILEADFLLRS